MHLALFWWYCWYSDVRLNFLPSYSLAVCQNMPNVEYYSFFYRAMHMHKIDMPSPGVCPSVTFVDNVKTHKDNFEIFSPSGSEAILVFPYQTGWRHSDGKLGTPLRWGGASNARGLWENDDFRPISRSIWETVIVRRTHSARQCVTTEFSFHPYNI